MKGTGTFTKEFMKGLMIGHHSLLINGEPYIEGTLNINFTLRLIELNVGDDPIMFWQYDEHADYVSLDGFLIALPLEIN